MLADGGFLAAHFTFPIRLTENPEAARRLADALARPCFRPLSRAFKTVKSKDSGHVPLTAENVLGYLTDAKNHHVGADNGRDGDLAAKASFPTGEHNRAWNVEKPRFTGYVIVPHDAALLEERLAALKEIASALQVVYGAISFEATHGDAQAFALAMRPYGEFVSVSRRKERRAQELYPDQLAARIPGPEWALFLSEGHQAELPADKIRTTGAFAKVEELEGRRAYLQLTDDPADARDVEVFEAKIDAAREALQPISMDLSGVSFS
jgi:hypothetical protein